MYLWLYRTRQLIGASLPEDSITRSSKCCQWRHAAVLSNKEWDRFHGLTLLDYQLVSQFLYSLLLSWHHTLTGMMPSYVDSTAGFNNGFSANNRQNNNLSMLRRSASDTTFPYEANNSLPSQSSLGNSSGKRVNSLAYLVRNKCHSGFRDAK